MLHKIAFHGHSHWRYMIFTIGALAIIAMLVGWLGKRNWSKGNKVMALLYLITMDIQLLFGLVLWGVEQRWSGVDPLRSWEHPFTMIIAIVLAHIGFKSTKKDVEDVDKFKKAAIFYLASMALVVVGVLRITSKI